MKSRGLRQTRPAPPELYGRSGFAPPRAGRQTRTFTPIKRKKTVQPKGHTAYPYLVFICYADKHKSKRVFGWLKR